MVIKKERVGLVEEKERVTGERVCFQQGVVIKKKERERDRTSAL